MSTGYNPSIVTDSLIFCLDAANTKSYPGSGTTWSDLSGQSNNATINGSTYNSENGGYFDFDGTNDYATFNPGSDIAFGTGQFAIEIWTDFVGEGPFYFIDIRNSSATSRWALFVNAFEKLEWYTGSGSYILQTPVWNTGNNGWNQIVFSREGTGGNQFKFYVNGAFISAVTDSTNYNTSSTEASIGRRYSNSEFLDGKISQLRIYKGKALSASEVLHNFDAVKGRYLDKPLTLSGISYSLT